MDGVLFIYALKQMINVECDEDIVTDIDGEKGPDFPLHIKCERRAIKVLGYLKECNYLS